MADIKVLMVPRPNPDRPGMSGIDRVIEAYTRYLPDYGITLVKSEAAAHDVLAVHAGLTARQCTVCHCHGLYWTADYPSPKREYGSNAMIVEALRHARQVTVPSAWVAETIQRDMRLSPHVIPHGIDWDAWQHAISPGDYVLWNKNRNWDVCDPRPVAELAQRFKSGKFITTFMPHKHPHMGNVQVTGLLPPEDMKLLIQGAAVYLATTKETFGIGTLEAMASGVPVLGYRHGGAVDLVEHGVSGYLAAPGDLDDLAEGLMYCLKHRATLGANGRELARRWRWPEVVEKVADVYRLAAQDEPPTVGVVIPVYNKPIEEVRRAIESVVNQSCRPDRVILVDDGSTVPDDYDGLVRELGAGAACELVYHKCDNQGVAVARNRGIEQLGGCKYVCCLDADDWIAPDFLQVCVQALERDTSLGVAYASLYYHKPDGSHGISQWPGPWNYDAQLQRQNQIPTCCVFRREMWQRLGGYRGRYCPHGAGEEDAEFWTRAGAYGFGAAWVEPHASAVPRYLDLKARARRVPSPQQLADAGLADVWPRVQSSFFHYSWQTGLVSGQAGRKPTDWLAWHPWARDHKHPFASYATPFGNRPSHPVRQYDQPKISVIIPVGPGHEKTVIDALDSLEAQTFRGWEVILVDDMDRDSHWEFLKAGILMAYPYVRYYQTMAAYKADQDGKRQLIDILHSGHYGPLPGIEKGQPLGAGHARNLGAEVARAPFLFFLDADDWLYPQALQKHLDAWAEHKAIVYSDYVEKAIGVDPKGLAADIEVLAYFEKRDEHVLGYRAADFDCERAQRQPELPWPFIWCNVTALIPRAWHDAIGGFDESMESWEDVDYHWRMARAGYCYQRIPEPLMVYRFYTGSRRDDGLQKHKSLVQYLKSKYEGLTMAPCSSCGGSPRQRTVPDVRSTTAPAMRAASPGTLGSTANLPRDETTVLVRDVSRKRGDRPVTGRVTKHQYNPSQDGNEFLMFREDVFGYDQRTGKTYLIEPQRFVPVVEREAEPPPVEREDLPPPEPLVEPSEVPPVTWAELDDEPEPVERPFDLQLLPGVGASRARQLQEAGLDTPEAILAAGVTGLKRVGLTATTAAKIVEYLSSE